MEFVFRFLIVFNPGCSNDELYLVTAESKAHDIINGFSSFYRFAP